MNNKNIVIDFEFNKFNEKSMGLVCMSAQVENDPKLYTFWTRSKEERNIARDWLAQYKGATLIAYAVELAESRCVTALGLLPRDFQWRDLMLEHRWLKNHDHKYTYGRVVKTTQGFSVINKSIAPIVQVAKKATNADKDAADRRNFANARARGCNSISPVGGSLIDCLVFFDVIKTQEELNHDYQRKHDVRNYIIAGENLEARKQEILEYCESDITCLWELADKLKKEIDSVLARPCIVFDPVRNAKLGFPILKKEMKAPFNSTDIVLSMGRWAAFNGYIATKGLPLDKARCEKIMEVAPKILEELKISYNSEHWERYRIEDSRDNVKPVEFTGDVDEYYAKLARRRKGNFPYFTRKIIEDAKATQQWVENLVEEFNYDWPRTESGAWSTSSPDLEKLVSGGESDPIKTYLSQSRAVDAINGLSKGRNEGLWATVGSDYIHRFKSNPLKTQTARHGLGASSFIFSAPAWFRIMINPPEEECLIDLDFSGEEIFIGGAMSNDRNYMDAYLSGDFYWYNAQISGAIPKELPVPTEEQRGLPPFNEYKAQRQNSKVSSLGIGFGMASGALANHLSVSTGKKYSKEDAQAIINAFIKSYPNFAKYRAFIQDQYKQSPINLYLSNGWRMGPNNGTPNSYLNLPIQGTGSVILQVCCYKLEEAGIDVRATMHDAITISSKVSEKGKNIEIARKCMLEACIEVLGIEGMRIGEAEVINHGDIWLHGKGYRDYERFKKYLDF